jgi:hypothetical protein
MTFNTAGSHVAYALKPTAREAEGRCKYAG